MGVPIMTVILALADQADGDGITAPEIIALTGLHRSQVSKALYQAIRTDRLVRTDRRRRGHPIYLAPAYLAQPPVNEEGERPSLRLIRGGGLGTQS